jgi:hypothetical protein
VLRLVLCHLHIVTSCSHHRQWIWLLSWNVLMTSHECDISELELLPLKLWKGESGRTNVMYFGRYEFNLSPYLSHAKFFMESQAYVISACSSHWQLIIRFVGVIEFHMNIMPFHAELSQYL